MQKPIYGKNVAEYVMQQCIDDWVKWRDDGLYIDRGMFENDPTELLFRWTFVADADWVGAPDSLTSPSLPFPFNANQLAAFMLDGVGATLTGLYGAWEDGPDEGILEGLGIEARTPREAIRAAYGAYRNAVSVVGKFVDGPLQDRRHLYPTILRALKDDVSLHNSMRWAIWRKAMVRQLLQPPEEMQAQPEQVRPIEQQEREDWSTARPEAQEVRDVTADPTEKARNRAIESGRLEGLGRLKVRAEPPPTQDAEVPPQLDDLPQVQRQFAIEPNDHHAERSDGNKAKPETSTRPFQRRAAQDAAVLAALKKAGHDPRALTKNVPGKSGVKSETRAALEGTDSMFIPGSTIFEKAWERLTTSRDIAYKK